MEYTTDTHHFFQGFTSPLSNFHFSRFNIKQYTFHSSEQAFMYMKAKEFHDEIVANLILQARTPSECKKLGRQVCGFDQRIWGMKCEEYMKVILKYKFSQNEKAAKHLASTGTKILVECGVHDRKWAIGLGIENPKILNPDLWLGENLLGECLMWTRNYIRTHY